MANAIQDPTQGAQTGQAKALPVTPPITPAAPKAPAAPGVPAAPQAQGAPALPMAGAAGTAPPINDPLAFQPDPSFAGGFGATPPPGGPAVGGLSMSPANQQAAPLPPAAPPTPGVTMGGATATPGTTVRGGYQWQDSLTPSYGTPDPDASGSGVLSDDVYAQRQFASNAAAGMAAGGANDPRNGLTGGTPEFTAALGKVNAERGPNSTLPNAVDSRGTLYGQPGYSAGGDAAPFVPETGAPPAGTGGHGFDPGNPLFPQAGDTPPSGQPPVHGPGTPGSPPVYNPPTGPGSLPVSRDPRVGNGVSTTPTTPENALTNSTISVDPGVDRFKIANDRLRDTIENTLNPQFEQDQIAANRYNFGRGGGIGGNARGSQSALMLQKQRNTNQLASDFLNPALEGTIGDAYKNADVATQQQGFQRQQGQDAFGNAVTAQELSDRENEQSFRQAVEQAIIGGQGDPAQMQQWLAMLNSGMSYEDILAAQHLASSQGG